MPNRQFGFLPDSFLEDANACANHFEIHGFRVKADHSLPSAPSVPTLYATRSNTQLVVHVLSKFDRNFLSNWRSYAKSTGKDFRVCCVFRKEVLLKPELKQELRTLEFGALYVQSGEVIEELPAKDLGLSFEPPLLSSLPKSVQRRLGRAYEHFGRSNWREGFEDACQALENSARKYLLKEIKKGRVTKFIKKTKTVTANVHKVKRMPMGPLAQAFGEIPNQTHVDSQIAKIIDKLNRDRINIVHYRDSASAERSLRKNVGMHMWQIVTGISLIV